MPTKKILMLAYILVLAASHGYRRFFGSDQAAPPDRRFVSVREVDRGRLTKREVRIAYTDSDPDSPHAPVVLVHGSPGSASVFHLLTPMLAPYFRVIAIDLPGFGSSTLDVPDYSFLAHAHYLVRLLDALKIPTAQLVGFSMGGGVVLYASQLAPQKIRSLVMLSAIGVQEHELTGSYWANHAIHGFQAGAIWLLPEVLPHFGYLDRLMFTMEYARNFYDSDQRPLRGILAAYRGPMLIVHGTRDRNVPIEAAREHHRLALQSELVEIDDNHFMVFTHPEVFAARLVEFLNRAAAASDVPPSPGKTTSRGTRR